MEEVLRFLKTYEAAIYVILGLVALWTLRKMATAWKELRSSQFGLERESAQRRFNNSLTGFAFLLLFGISEFIMVSIVYPDFPNTQVLSTPTLNILATPTVTLQPVQEATSTIDEMAPTIDASDTGGCVTGQVEWTFPAAGETLQGEVTLRGTVNVPNLGFYQYEYSQPGSTVWTTIAAGENPITDQPMGGEGSGRWDTSTLTPGDYLLRLIARDNANNLFPACIVNVRIIAP
ncbi:MAG: hypothetical protein ACYC6H_00280 [Bellilinea sp.]